MGVRNGIRQETGETFEGENFQKFRGLWLFVKVFSVKFGGVVSFGMVKASNLRKFSP